MSVPSSTAPTLTNEVLAQTYGVLFVGFVVATVLYGLTFFQTYIYYSRYPKDNIWTRITVGVLSVLDTATSALSSQALYYYLIAQFSNPDGLVDATSTLCAENGLAVIVTVIVQVFYAVRVFATSDRQWALLALIGLIAVASFVFGIAMTVQIFRQKRLSGFSNPHIMVVAGLNQGLATLADILITGALCFYLSPSRNHVVREKGKMDWFDKLSVYVVNRGTCSLLIQALYLLTFVTMPSKQIWMPFHLVVSKVYVNSLLSMLNTREAAHGRGAYEEEPVSTMSHKSSGVATSRVGANTSRSLKFNVIDPMATTKNGSETVHDIELDKIHSSANDEYLDESAINLGSNMKIRVETQVEEVYDYKVAPDHVSDS